MACDSKSFFKMAYIDNVISNDFKLFIWYCFYFTIFKDDLSFSVSGSSILAMFSIVKINDCQNFNGQN